MRRTSNISYGDGLRATGTGTVTTPAQSSEARLLIGVNLKSCKDGGDNTCSTPVQVSRGETNDPKGCKVTWAYRGYEVKKKSTKVKLVWEIEKDPYDGDTYRFHPNDGVKLKTDDENDTNQDLWDQGHESKDGQKFRWRS